MQAFRTEVSERFDRVEKRIDRVEDEAHDFRTEVKAVIGGLRTEMNNLRTDIQAKMHALKTELKADIQQLRKDQREDAKKIDEVYHSRDTVKITFGWPAFARCFSRF